MYDYCFIRKNDTKGGVTVKYPATSKRIPERAGYIDTQLSLLCTFLPLVALRMTNRHAICFICCLKCISKWIRYADMQ